MVNVFVGLLFERFIGIYSWRRKREGKKCNEEIKFMLLNGKVGRCNLVQPNYVKIAYSGKLA